MAATNKKTFKQQRTYRNRPISDEVTQANEGKKKDANTGNYTITILPKGEQTDTSKTEDDENVTGEQAGGDDSKLNSQATFLTVGLPDPSSKFDSISTDQYKSDVKVFDDSKRMDSAEESKLGKAAAASAGDQKKTVINVVAADKRGLLQEIIPTGCKVIEFARFANGLRIVLKLFEDGECLKEAIIEFACIVASCVLSNLVEHVLWKVFRFSKPVSCAVGAWIGMLAAKGAHTVCAGIRSANVEGWSTEEHVTSRKSLWADFFGGLVGGFLGVLGVTLLSSWSGGSRLGSSTSRPLIRRVVRQPLMKIKKY